MCGPTIKITDEIKLKYKLQINQLNEFHDKYKLKLKYNKKYNKQDLKIYFDEIFEIIEILKNDLLTCSNFNRFYSNYKFWNYYPPQSTLLIQLIYIYFEIYNKFDSEFHENIMNYYIRDFINPNHINESLFYKTFAFTSTHTDFMYMKISK